MARAGLTRSGQPGGWRDHGTYHAHAAGSGYRAADRAGSRVNREAGGGRGGHRGRRRADHRAVRGEPAAPAAQPVRGDHVRAQRSGAAQVDHGPEPVRGGQRIIPGGGQPDPEGEPAARVPRRQPDPVRRPGQRDRLRQLRAAQGLGHPGVGQPDGGYHPAAPAAAGAGRAQRQAVVRLRPAAGPAQPDRQLLLRQPGQPAAGLRAGPAEDPDRGAAEPAAGRGAAQHDQHADRDDALAGLPAGHRDLRRRRPPRRAERTGRGRGERRGAVRACAGRRWPPARRCRRRGRLPRPGLRRPDRRGNR